MACRWQSSKRRQFRRATRRHRAAPAQVGLTALFRLTYCFDNAADTAPPATAPVPAITAVPAAMPPPPAAKAPPPTAAKEAFVRATPDSVLIAVPVLAAPSHPAAPAAAASVGAATNATPPVATVPATTSSVLPGFSTTTSTTSPATSMAPPTTPPAISTAPPTTLPAISTAPPTKSPTKSKSPRIYLPFVVDVNGKQSRLRLR